MSSTTIVCLQGGPHHGRHDTSRNDVNSDVLRISQGSSGDEIAGYRLDSVFNFGTRFVVHATSLEVIGLALAAEQRDRDRAEKRKPWLALGGVVG